MQPKSDFCYETRTKTGWSDHWERGSNFQTESRILDFRAGSRNRERILPGDEFDVA